MGSEVHIDLQIVVMFYAEHVLNKNVQTPCVFFMILSSCKLPKFHFLGGVSADTCFFFSELEAATEGFQS